MWPEWSRLEPGRFQAPRRSLARGPLFNFGLLLKAGENFLRRGVEPESLEAGGNENGKRTRAIGRSLFDRERNLPKCRAASGALFGQDRVLVPEMNHRPSVHFCFPFLRE